MCVCVCVCARADMYVCVCVGGGGMFVGVVGVEVGGRVVLSYVRARVLCVTKISTSTHVLKQIVENQQYL